MAGRVAGEEDAALGRAAQLVGDPVALVLVRRLAQVLGEQHRRVLDVEARVEGADPDPQLVLGGEGPAVAGGDVPAVDPDLEVLAAARRVDLEAARERRVGGLVAVAAGQHAAPAERVDDQRRADRAAVGVDGQLTAAVPARGASVDLRRLECGVAVRPEQLADLPVVEGREGPGKVVAGGSVGRVDDELARSAAARPPSGRWPAASRSGSRRPRSAARRSRSGRRPARRPRSRPARGPRPARRSSLRRSARRGGP